MDYEFTEPAQADVALDIAGTPMAATAETLPAGVGGIGDDSGVLKFESVEIEADVTMAGGDGYGGYQPGDVAATPAAGVDGLGGAVTGRAGTPAAGSEADGQGGAVVEPAVAVKVGEAADRGQGEGGRRCRRLRHVPLMRSVVGPLERSGRPVPGARALSTRVGFVGHQACAGQRSRPINQDPDVRVRSGVLIDRRAPKCSRGGVEYRQEVVFRIIRP